MQGAALGCDVIELITGECKPTEMQGADLRRAEMQGADLREAKMQGFLIHRDSLDTFESEMKEHNYTLHTAHYADNLETIYCFFEPS